MKHVVVVGAGMGGLSAGAVLAHSGLDVTVLEAHIYAGGCAGTFFHQGYRFDAGATLAAGFLPGGPMDTLAREGGVEAWPVRPEELALTVHLPDGAAINRWTDHSRWKQARRMLSDQGEPFWDWQERTADAVWELAGRLPPWPPTSLSDVLALARHGLAACGTRPTALPGLLRDAFSVTASRLPQAQARLRLFVDGQLLISAQTSSGHANALYAAAALDLARRGVVQVEGGIGNLAQTLVDAIRRHGGRVHFRHEATALQVKPGGPVSVETRSGASFPADILLLNLTPWEAGRLLGKLTPPRLQRLPAEPPGWGAFTVYAGVDTKAIPEGLGLHHQILVAEPLGEGNSVFLSLSPDWDRSRAPTGRRAITLSTHTRLGPWWSLEKDSPAFAAREAAYTERLLAVAERVIPGLSEVADPLLPGTPVTFSQYTRRSHGWVGGFPQINLWQSIAPRLGPATWLVGDSVFPGQSIAATALGGRSVAHAVLHSIGCATDEPAGLPRLTNGAVP